MADSAIGGEKPPEKSKKGLKRPGRRTKIRIDMTPMVDIAFLLLIFYMVSTVFSRPTLMEFSRPPKDGINKTTQLAESRFLEIFVDKNDSCYYQLPKTMQRPARVSFEKLVKIINLKNRSVPDLIMTLKLDTNASYSSLVRLMDEIQKMERGINAEIEIARRSDPQLTEENFSPRFTLQDMTEYDEYLLDMANKERRTK